MSSTAEVRGPDEDQGPGPALLAGDAAGEAARRRTFAVISHPDAGKSTLTEALALHARVIQEAGAVHGKAGRRGTVSDWMEMERNRGISITSSVLQFGYRDAVINLLDTPGHADFSEDTYRVLAAVDGAVMLLDAAKGLEPQTLKLFEVCRAGKVPIITVINKWDRPGKEPLELLDEIESTIGLKPTPVNWPVGIAGDFRGLLDRRTGEYVKFTRTSGGATVAPQEVFKPVEAAELEGVAWETAVEESELLEASGADHDQDAYIAEETSPLLFASAVQNFGVKQLLDVLVELAPAPAPRPTVKGDRRELDAPFSAFVFKVQAGMDTAHRDRVAYARVCSGVFERGMVVTHAASGKPFHTKYAQALFGRERSTLETAYPGDVIGLVNANALRVGDSLYVDKAVEFPAIPSFAPEHFSVMRAKDVGRYKQFRRGVEQLDQEGVVQVLRSDLRGDQAPVLAAVGPMQFEVSAYRMEHEFNSPVMMEPLEYTIARITDPDAADTLSRLPGAELMMRSDGTALALFLNKWRMMTISREHPGLRLDPLVGGASAV
ncbi:peptide chain release factor 3 [Motilibacter deserti]|uniref:Peptide chain release factor 3 n=1 Tax=Motilibacter deserti TaxID=2714956 RepID=A0ABX0GVM7_9ACTN|nr:peptide chain release factor 3 [Motilibacter deserti]NHC13694.1 peptide chain release factor 3 [Motilibacter deserti]